MANILRRFSRATLPVTCQHWSPVTVLPGRQFSSDDLRKNVKVVLAEGVKSSKDILSAAPPAALGLGVAGLIPFVAAPWTFIKTGYFDPNWEFYQVAYGASILSFLGGVRWGLTLPPGRPAGAEANWSNLGYAVLPSLAAWTSLMLPTPIAAGATALCLGLVGYYDIGLPGYPSWYKGMRLILTSIAVASLLVTLLCHAFMRESAGQKQH